MAKNSSFEINNWIFLFFTVIFIAEKDRTHTKCQFTALQMIDVKENADIDAIHIFINVK